VRHAEATAIDVVVQQGEQNLEVKIKDNGKGFVEEEVMKEKRGMGLFNIRKRVALIGGDVSIVTQNGTEIKIVVPYP
jgi:two-component system NarL family sensor kinase